MLAKRFALTAALVMMSVGANAADLGSMKDQPAVSYTPDWSGYYVGIFGGVGAFDGLAVDEGGDALDSDGAESNLRGFAGLAGVAIGVNRQRGSALLGLEADFSGTSWDDENTFDDDYRVESRMNWLATLRARAGLVHDNAMFYITAGVGLASLEGCASDDVDSCEPDDDEIAHVDRNAWGLVAGVGTEFKFSPSMSVKAEYLYFQSAEKDVNYDSDASDEVANFSISSHMFKVGLNYHFH